ncbi:hypothetical protein [Streptomyces altiplanensis]
MSIQIRFISDQHDDYTYEDGEGREYRYVVADNGSLVIFEKEVGGHITRDADPIAVYGPAAWFSVSGDLRKKTDTAPSRGFAF